VRMRATLYGQASGSGQLEDIMHTFVYVY
jgi:hypothetical protein